MRIEFLIICTRSTGRLAQLKGVLAIQWNPHGNRKSVEFAACEIEQLGGLDDLGSRDPELLVEVSNMGDGIRARILRVAAVCCHERTRKLRKVLADKWKTVMNVGSIEAVILTQRAQYNTKFNHLVRKDARESSR